jgi:hypothetical protein
MTPLGHPAWRREQGDVGSETGPGEPASTSTGPNLNPAGSPAALGQVETAGARGSPSREPAGALDLRGGLRRRFGFRLWRREDRPKVPSPRMWRRITMVGVTSHVDRQLALSGPGHLTPPAATSVGWEALTTQGRIARIRAVASGDATGLRALPAYQRRQLVPAVLRDAPTGRE